MPATQQSGRRRDQECAVFLAWIAQGVFMGMLAVLCSRYLSQYWQKSKRLTALVIAVLVLNLVASTLAYVSAWKAYTEAAPAFGALLPLSSVIASTLDLVTILLGQLFFFRQAWILANRRKLIAAVLLVLYICEFASFALEAVAITRVSEPYRPTRRNVAFFIKSVRARNAFAAAATFAPSVITCYVLIQGKSVCFTKSMRVILASAIRLTIMCSAIPTCIALLGLFCSVGTGQYSPISSFCFVVLGRVFSVTLMWALLVHCSRKDKHSASMYIESEKTKPPVFSLRSNQVKESGFHSAISVDLSILEEVEEPTTGVDLRRDSIPSRAPSIQNHDQPTSPEQAMLIAPFMLNEPSAPRPITKPRLLRIRSADVSRPAREANWMLKSLP